MGKEKPPHVVYTTEERKQLKEYAKTRDLAVKDDRIAARHVKHPPARSRQLLTRQMKAAVKSLTSAGTCLLCYQLFSI